MQIVAIFVRAKYCVSVGSANTERLHRIDIHTNALYGNPSAGWIWISAVPGGTWDSFFGEYPTINRGAIFFRPPG